MTYNDVMISKVFMERNKFVVIGLTGRTGSGCTTAATILESIDQRIPNLEEITYKNQQFFDGMNKRRYQVIKRYYEENSQKFFSIKVSDLISAYILNHSKDEIFDFINKSTTDLDESKINKALSLGVFSNNFIKEKFQPLIKALLDHTDKTQLSKENERETL